MPDPSPPGGPEAPASRSVGPAGAPGSVLAEGDTLVTLLERAARPVGAAPGAAIGRRPETAPGRGGARGLRFLDRRERPRFVPWPAVHGAARETAGRLVAAGVRPGDRVGLIYPTGEEFFAALFGILLAGAVPAPLYPPVRLGRLDEYHRRTAAMLRAVGARLVLADSRVRRLLGQTVAAAGPELGCRTLDRLPPGAPERLGAVRPTPDDLALIQFSSGTTVEPKPVALSQRAVLAQTRLLNSFWPDTEEVVHSGVSWLPLYHDMGLIGCVFPALERVADLTLIGPEVFVARPAVWLRALSRYRATVSPAPNFAYGLCVAKVRDAEIEGIDLSAWRAALDGAESVAPATLRAFVDRFAPFGFRPEALTPVYGLSEASLAVTFAPLGKRFSTERFVRGSLEPGCLVQTVRPVQAVGQEEGPGVAEGAGAGGGEGGEPARELVSVGVPVPGFEIEIRPQGEDGDPSPGGAGSEAGPLEEGIVGRVWVRGPSLMEGYFGRPEASAAALVDGWLDTGDLGFLRGGELYLTGRAKDLVIVRGKNVAPEEIERLALDVPGARAGCAVAVSWVPPATGGGGGDSEELLVFVEHARTAGAEERAALPERVRRAVLTGLGLAPDRVEILAPGTLPRTSSGKLRRGEALRRWSEGTLEPPAPVGPARIAAAMLRSGLAFARSGRAGSRRAGADGEAEGDG